MDRPDVVVVGAGVAVAAAALLAAEHGRRVEVVERGPFVGGRAVSFVGRDSALSVDSLDLDAAGFRKALAHAGAFVARAEPALETILARRLLDGFTLETSKATASSGGTAPGLPTCAPASASRWTCRSTPGSPSSTAPAACTRWKAAAPTRG
jgi:isorenieratene synthase